MCSLRPPPAPPPSLSQGSPRHRPEDAATTATPRSRRVSDHNQTAIGLRSRRRTELQRPLSRTRRPASRSLPASATQTCAEVQRASWSGGTGCVSGYALRPPRVRAVTAGVSWRALPPLRPFSIVAKDGRHHPLLTLLPLSLTRQLLAPLRLTFRCGTACHGLSRDGIGGLASAQRQGGEQHEWQSWSTRRGAHFANY